MKKLVVSERKVKFDLKIYSKKLVISLSKKVKKCGKRIRQRFFTWDLKKSGKWFLNGSKINLIFEKVRIKDYANPKIKKMAVFIRLLGKVSSVFDLEKKKSSRGGESFKLDGSSVFEFRLWKWFGYGNKLKLETKSVSVVELKNFIFVLKWLLCWSPAAHGPMPVSVLGPRVPMKRKMRYSENISEFS